MTHFYAQLLKETELNHDAAVAATQKPVIGPTPNLTITKPPDFTPKSDLELAKAAQEQGKDVELNDDNQIVDKRDLLVAGLNLSGTNTRRLGAQGTNKNNSADGSEGPSHRAVGTAASRREINQRRAREIEEQMQTEQERVAREKQRTDEEALQRTVAKRNSEDAVQGARERYLARKRQKMEGTAEAAPS